MTNSPMQHFERFGRMSGVSATAKLIIGVLAAVVIVLGPLKAEERPSWLELKRFSNEQKLDLNKAQREMLERSKRESTDTRWATERRVQKQRLDQRFLQERQLRKQRLIERRSRTDTLEPTSPRPSTQLQRSKTEQRQQQLQFKMRRRAREALPAGSTSQPGDSLRFKRELLPANRGLEH